MGRFLLLPFGRFYETKPIWMFKGTIGGGQQKKPKKPQKQTNKMVFIAYESLPRSCQAHQERMFTTLTNMDGGNIGYCVGYRDCYYEPN